MESAIGCTKVFETAIGTVAISASLNGLQELTFLAGNHARLEFVNDEISEAFVNRAGSWLQDYLKGSSHEFDGPLQLEGTAFQKSVWQEIRSIRFGQTLSYGDIARRIGKPKASRAVGAAVGANPIPLIVPCHRVMGSTGRITGYSGGEGIPTKRKLLELEDIGYRE